MYAMLVKAWHYLISFKGVVKQDEVNLEVIYVLLRNDTKGMQASLLGVIFQSNCMFTKHIKIKAINSNRSF